MTPAAAADNSGIPPAAAVDNSGIPPAAAVDNSGIPLTAVVYGRYNEHNTYINETYKKAMRTAAWLFNRLYKI